MATDAKKIIQNLLDFYDFTDKNIISVGAGGGQFIEYARKAKHVIAIDNDKQALNRLEESLKKSGLLQKFTLIHDEFKNVEKSADVVLFEFCLHEMSNPKEAIIHAKSMAKEIVIDDHWPSSNWAYYVDEDEKAKKSWADIKSFRPEKIQKYNTDQFFEDYNELYQKVKIQGDKTIERISIFKNHKNFKIPMSYGFAKI